MVWAIRPLLNGKISAILFDMGWYGNGGRKDWKPYRCLALLQIDERFEYAGPFRAEVVPSRCKQPVGDQQGMPPAAWECVNLPGGHLP